MGPALPVSDTWLDSGTASEKHKKSKARPRLEEDAAAMARSGPGLEHCPLWSGICYKSILWQGATTTDPAAARTE